MVKSERQQRGCESEAFVLNWYRARGFKKVAQNISIPRVGELDLIVHKGGLYVVVEVRSLKRGGISPLETVNTGKLKRIARSALLYFTREFGPHLEGVRELRFDLVGISGEGSTRELIHVPNLHLPHF